MYPHSGRRHYVYDRTRGTVVSTSLPTHGSTPRASKLAAASFYVPTGRRVMVQEQVWAPTDSTVPMRAPILSDQEARFVTGHREEEEDFRATTQPLTDRRMEELQDLHIEEAERLNVERGDLNSTTYEARLRYGSTPRTARSMQDPLEMKSEMKEDLARAGSLPSQAELNVAMQLDLKDLLRNSNLQQFYPALLNNGIDTTGRLAYLTESDLISLGMNMRERAQLREALITHSSGARGTMVDQLLLSSRQSPTIQENPNPQSPPPRSPTPPMQRRNVQPTQSTFSSTQRQRAKSRQPPLSNPAYIKGLREGGGLPKSAPSKFKSTHPLHPSHPPSPYDYTSRVPPPSFLHAPVQHRSAQIPQDARHISPQPTAREYLSPRTRELTSPAVVAPPPQRASHAHGGGRGSQRDPNEESAPLQMPQETIRTEQARQAAKQTQQAESAPRVQAYSTPRAPPSRSPPLQHAADYPLDTPLHGDQTKVHTEQCVDGGEHFHNFDESRHPPHLSHPMPASDIVPHARRQIREAHHPPHASHPMPPYHIVPHASRDALASFAGAPLPESADAFRSGGGGRSASVPKLDLGRLRQSM